MSSYDVVVIGSGPGGYVSAIKAAQLGLKVAVVEKRATFGGTCLNVGCIPSKALLHASEVYAEASHGFDSLGVMTEKPKLDWGKMLTHKQSVIDANTSGVAFLFKKNKIDSFIGTGTIIAADKVKVKAEDGGVTDLATKNIIIATGSDSAALPGVNVEIDEKAILSSTGALAMEKVPESMVVVGAGVIGSELGSVYARLGAKVTIIEFLDKALGAVDADLSRNFQRLLQRQGVDFKLGTKVCAIERTDTGALVTYQPTKGGQSQEITADAVLIATGRVPYTKNLGLDKIGVKLDVQGRVEIDNKFATNIAGIYAIGDVVKGPMLAHKAEDEGVALAEILAGQAGHVNYDVIPSVIYTQPEVACVGKSEEELKAAGIEYNVGKFSFTANGRARAMRHTDGFVKILACKKTDKVLGGHILGFGAGEMIHEIVVLMEFGGAAEDLARICHAHPTMSEAVREAAMAACDKPIHM